MDLRTRLRMLVNREGYLGPIRLLLLRLIDPVEWYMRSKQREEEPRLPRQRARGATGWTSYASLAHEATAAIAHTAPQHRVEDPERQKNYLRSVNKLRREHAVLLQAKAVEVLKGNSTTIETTGGTVGARLVRFRNGAVLERWHTSPRDSGRGRMRVERLQFSDLSTLTMDCLAEAIVGLGPDARPIVEGAP